MKLNLNECDFWSQDIGRQSAINIRDKNGKFYTVSFATGKIIPMPGVLRPDGMKWYPATIEDCKAAMEAYASGSFVSL